MILAQQQSDIIVSHGIESVLFFGFALVAVLSAIGVVLCRQIVHMAICLLFALCSVAFLYFLIGAEFLAAIQLIVYVGGTLILIIFGVMLTSKNPYAALDISIKEKILGWSIGIVSIILLSVLSLQLIGGPASTENTSMQNEVAAASTPTITATSAYGLKELGENLLTRYMLPFELTGVLLLIVMIGAAYIAKGRHDQLSDLPASYSDIGGGE